MKDLFTGLSVLGLIAMQIGFIGFALTGSMPLFMIGCLGIYAKDTFGGILQYITIREQTQMMFDAIIAKAKAQDSKDEQANNG